MRNQLIGNLLKDYNVYTSRLISYADLPENQKEIGHIYRDKAITCTDLAENYRQQGAYKLALTYGKAAKNDMEEAISRYKEARADKLVFKCETVLQQYEANLKLLEECCTEIELSAKRKYSTSGPSTNFVGFFRATTTQPEKRSRSNSETDLSMMASSLFTGPSSSSSSSTC